MRTHLWCRSKLCSACRDCEAACVFLHNPDWQPELDIKVLPEDQEKVQALLGEKPTPEQVKKFVALREMLRKKEKTPTPPLLTVVEEEEGNYALTCRHCEDPKCAKACQIHAIQRTQEGVILGPEDGSKCIGCNICAQSCAFGIPRFSSQGKMIKCDLCVERLRAGKEPACVAICQEKALMFKDLRGVYTPKPQGNEEIGYGIRELWHNDNKDPEYMLRFRGNGGGHWTAEQLDVICKWADKLVDHEEYEAGYLDITLRQDIELHHLQFASEEQKAEFFQDLKDAGIYLGNFGPLFRNIVSCIGGSCSKSRADAKKLGWDLYNTLNEVGFNLPRLKGKIKVGISGCLEGCGHMRMYDITIAAAQPGDVEGEPIEKNADQKSQVVYRVFLGGNMGRFPQPGIKVAELAKEEEVIDLIIKIAEFFKDYCELGNIHRLSYWIRVKYGKTGDPFIFSVDGIEAFLQDLTAWARWKYGELSWMKKLAMEDPIPQSVLDFRDYHQKKLTPMDIYEREDVFPRLKVEGVE